MIQMLANAGSDRIVASSRSPQKSEQALGFGATEIVDTNSFANGKQPDNFVPCHTVFECSGTENGIALAPRLAANQGIIGAAGFYTGAMPLPGEDVFARELTIVGVRASGANGDRSEFVRWPRTENLKLASSYLHAGKMSVSSLISHRLKPEELVDAYEIVRTKSEPYMLMVLDWR
jgi:threonine dehydrogenase-like Zn-dependent dehydrogenase